MPAELASANLVCRYNIFDIRTIDAGMPLRSPFPADSVIAILSRYSERPEMIRQILARIARIKAESAREDAFSKLMILAGLRKLGDAVRQEVQNMPILSDMMDHDVIGPAIRQGLEQGSRNEALSFARRLISARFGPLPALLEDRLGTLSVSELEDLGLRVLNATAITDLLDRT